MTPQKEVLTPVSGCHLTVRNAAVFFPPDGGKNFFGFSGIKKGANLRFMGGLRLAGCLFQSGCMTIRRGAFNVT